jgi:curved DNA-binding protein CbpA
MDATKEWPAILKFETGATITEDLVSQRYRELAKTYHPDAGGTVADMQQLNLAKQLALKWIAGERRRQEEIKRAEEIAAQHFAAAQRSMQDAYRQQAQAMQNYASQLGSLFGDHGLGQDMSSASYNWRAQSNSYRCGEPASADPVSESVKPQSRNRVTGFFARLFNGHR